MLPATLWGGDMYHIGRIFNDLINVCGGGCFLLHLGVGSTTFSQVDRMNLIG